jgi:hypothetical protein
MDYPKLKSITSVKAFNLIRKYINYPVCEFYITNYTGLDKPIDYYNIDLTSITSLDYIFIKSMECVYTYDNLIVNNSELKLGTEYSLIMYVRYDDVPDIIINNMSNTIVKFNNIWYNINNPMNLYNILYQIKLSDNL